MKAKWNMCLCIFNNTSDGSALYSYNFAEDIKGVALDSSEE